MERVTEHLLERGIKLNYRLIFRVLVAIHTCGIE